MQKVCEWRILKQPLQVNKPLSYKIDGDTAQEICLGKVNRPYFSICKSAITKKMGFSLKSQNDHQCTYKSKLNLTIS